MKPFARERSANAQRLIQSLNNNDQTFTMREERMMSTMQQEQPAHEVNATMFSPGLTQNSQYFLNTKEPQPKLSQKRVVSKNKTLIDQQPIEVGLP